MVFDVIALYKDYFQRYRFVDTAFYAVNITKPRWRSYVDGVSIYVQWVCVKGLVKV